MTHDYTRKGGVVHNEIMLPPHAPPSFSDRSTLWNSVELYEKAGNAQLAREIDAALPIELSREEQIRLVREYCSSQFVSKGMCVDFAIHDTDSGNPHCHIMLTMRPLDERGAWAAKSKKEYDLDENGERIRLPSGRYKTHKVDLTGWNDKSYSVAGPQLLQFNSNYVLSDPKGELLDTYGNVLVSQGYDVKVFNLKDRDKSDHYNPFAYIHDTDDIVVVAKNLIKNMKEDPRQKNTADPIWEEGSTSLLEALLAYVYFEQPPEMHNMNSVMELFVLMQHRYGPQGRSQLDDIFEDLAMEKPASFAARQYGLYHMAPDKTAQSIDVSLGMRMSAFNIPSIMKICEDDTIHLEELASDKKVALFVVTPDTTTAYNFLAAVMFQQCFQILVHTADNREDHCLPRHVRFLLDEFPNIGMIPDFQILISTIRSRNIGCTLIYQSIAQLKSQYGDDWGTILENCDSELVLGGGNNPESLEFFGKQLGKRTIEVLNTTENLGAQSSFSKNYQVASRDLMTPEEIRTMPRNRCLLMISGVVPFYSYKFDLKKHPNYALVEKEGHRPFDYERRAENSFAAFMKNVQEINNIELDDDESDT